MARPTPKTSEPGQGHSWPGSLIVETAGWAIPRAVAEEFSVEGSLLERYASRFPGVEINSTFYKSHLASTYARWRNSVPATFRFAVKMPRAISHEKRLVDVERELADFLLETSELGDRRGPLLLQLPPTFEYDASVATAFFRLIRGKFLGPLAIEPRHVSWFSAPSESDLVQYDIARVAADPPRSSPEMTPGGYRGLTYLRLHGSPRIYFSPYGDAKLGAVASILERSVGPRWCIFDNTASGAAAAER